MSETKSALIPKKTREQLIDISKKFSKLNTGSVGNELWLARDGGGGYEWDQIDLGVNKSGELVRCDQSGCSCYGPEPPTADSTYPLDSPIRVDNSSYYDTDIEDVVKELITVTNTIYKALNNEYVPPKDVIALPNSEVRRAVVELIGYDKIVDVAEVIDESPDGKLLKIKLQEDEDIVLVHVKDPSTTREYFLRVPPKTKTAREARAWTFGFEPEEFELEVES